MTNPLESTLKEMLKIESWSETKKKGKEWLKKIQDDPILDAGAKVGMSLIPGMGPILTVYYDKFKEQNETDVTADIKEIIERMTQMNEQQFKDFKTELQDNTKKILEDRNYLKQLVSDTKIIKENIEEISETQKTQTEKLDEITSSLKILLDKSGIHADLIDEHTPKSKILEENEEKIRSLENQLEKMESELLHTKITTQKNLRLLYQRANFYLIEEELDKAIILYDSVLDIDNKSLIALNNKGIALSHLQKYDDALSCYEKSLQIDPTFSEGWNNKGTALEKLGKINEASQCYDKAIELNLQYYTANYNKGCLLAMQEKRKEAMPYFEKTIALKPDHYSAWYNKGWTLSLLNDDKGAFYCYQQVVKIKPDDYITWFQMGSLYSKYGDFEQAKTCFKNMLKIDPQNPDAKRALKMIDEHMKNM